MRVAALFVLTAACAAARERPPSERAAARPTGTVVVDVVGFEHDRGQALVALYLTAKGFPDDPRHAHQKVAAPIRGDRARVTFTEVPAGEFAVAVLHDENGNLKMDTGFLGMPTEGYGFSRDARRPFGPPSFDDAKLRVAPGETREITVHLDY